MDRENKARDGRPVLLLSQALGFLPILRTYWKVHSIDHRFMIAMGFLYAAYAAILVSLKKECRPERRSTALAIAISILIPHISLFLSYMTYTAYFSITVKFSAERVLESFAIGAIFPYILFSGYAASLIAGLSTFLLLRYSVKKQSESPKW